jgi:hypothetical protein
VAFAEERLPGDCGDELLFELVEVLVHDDDALRAVAGLARVLHAATDGMLNRVVEVCRVKHQEDIAAAKFKHTLLQVTASLLGDDGARTL